MNRARFRISFVNGVFFVFGVGLLAAAVAACGGGGAGAPGPQPPASGPEPTAHGGQHGGGEHGGGKHAGGGEHAGGEHGHHGGEHGGGEHGHHGGEHGGMQHGHHGGGMHKRFEDAEKWAKVFDDPARDAWQQPDRVIAALGLTPAMVVADIGAGTGYFAVRLARAVPKGQVIATDIEPDMVRYLTERARREGLTNLRAVATPPDSPRLDKASVDRVLVVDVWHHLGDRAAYARQLAAALRPGGLIAVVDFKLDAKMGPPREHRLAPEAIAADLRAAGLKAEVAPVALQEQYIVIGRR